MRNRPPSVMRQSRCMPLFLLLRIQIIDQLDPALWKRLVGDGITLLAEGHTDMVQDEREK
jgi:hypothetical protein